MDFRKVIYYTFADVLSISLQTRTLSIAISVIYTSLIKTAVFLPMPLCGRKKHLSMKGIDMLFSLIIILMSY